MSRIKSVAIANESILTHSNIRDLSSLVNCYTGWFTKEYR